MAFDDLGPEAVDPCKLRVEDFPAIVIIDCHGNNLYETGPKNFKLSGGETAMTLREDALKLHRDNRGKIEVTSKVQVKDRRGLSLAYTPGVAEPCREEHKDPDKVYEYTSKGNMVAVVT